MNNFDFEHENYPWYHVIEDDEIRQGDIFEKCHIFIPPGDLADAPFPEEAITFDWEERDLIVMSQTCDMVKGRENVAEVVLCAVWNRSELTDGRLASDEGMEELRKGRRPRHHLLNKLSFTDFNREFRIVDFARIYSLPLTYLRRKAASQKRIRLLPPFCEHLSQSFARFFMRVGLPTDIPSFKR
jgi:hypothetical protein